MLDHQISVSERYAWAPMGLLRTIDTATIGWANASHALARSVAYADLPTERRSNWAEAYQAKAWPVVTSQLKQGAST